MARSRFDFSSVSGVEAANCFGPAGEGELGREVGLVVVVPVGEKDVNKAVSC